MRTGLFILLVAAIVVAVTGVGSTGLASVEADDAARAALQTRLQNLQADLRRMANYTSGYVAISVADGQGRAAFDINGDDNLPAASVIKLPVMVEVMRQASLGRFSLDRQVELLPEDRDCGSGDLCNENAGMTFSVRNLIRIMIDNSDNTATNMLIRLVGRQNVNDTMAGLGLTQTRLGDSIHVYDSSIRSLRTSTNDMMRLLLMMFERRLVSERASDLMLSFMAGQRHNDLLPEPLPKWVVVAHKTGTLHDTLNDVGIVGLEGSPYVICVITTHLEDLDDGARLIRKASKATYDAFVEAQFVPVAPSPTAPDAEPSPTASM